jgi:tRNA G18 (ribose-2'-O)-methylase SpoU
LNRKLLTSELNRLSVQQYAQADKSRITVILDNIRSGQNIGSIFRTSDAFRVHAVHLCGICACPPNKDIQKTALGASDNVEWQHWKDTSECVAELKDDGWTVISVEQSEGSIDLKDIRVAPDQKIALVFGNEVRGVDQEIIDQSDGCVSVEQHGTKHSLNVSVCAGIVIRDYFLLMHE